MLRQFGKYGRSALAAAAALLALPATGTAAPQALALVATQGSTDLICRDGACSAEFSSFCLQSGRFSPMPATTYHLEGTGDIRAIGTIADGSTIALDPARDLHFESLRSHVAVRVSVTPQAIRQYGLRSASVEIGDNVTLAPEAVAGDDNPQDGSSLAIASGPLRSLGRKIVDTDDTRMAAARLTGRLINALEAVPGRLAKPTADGLWDRVIGRQPDATQTAQQLARSALDMCSVTVERHRDITGDVRKCLQHHHDRFVVYLNTRYWEATGTGM